VTLLASTDHLLDRRRAATGPLEPLASSLARDLDPVLAHDLFLPRDKAKLTRAGGRCERDGSLLDFDPFSPRRHRCPRCGQEYSGDAHYHFWLYWYQLWLAERAVHAALLGAVGLGERFTRFATSVLDQYATVYLGYPNRDNVLGPTRPFFSTYLESIWLLQLSVALDLLETSRGPGRGGASFGEHIRDRLIEPSVALIASYDEGMSNRQVWNNAALFAGATLLGRHDDAERCVYGESGLLMHLSEALLGDGTWYEGENYHLFAHRGLWYGVAMCARANVEIPAELLRRFDEGFATPFLTALPDMTLPSRRDSQYKISLRQWRFAELCELGLARGQDDRLIGALARLYGDEVPRLDPERWRSSAEAERNTAPTRLDRSDLGWRSLLCAPVTLPPLHPTVPSTVVLEEQGIAVVRREREGGGGRIYVALDYGRSGGGHGHPDRLNLLFADGDRRWLDDMGTGSYVDPSLHWYRSTLAHNAPLVDGRSQSRVDGVLRGFGERDDATWITATAEIAWGVIVIRTLVVMADYFIDVVEWKSGSGVRFELPLHADLSLIDPPPEWVTAAIDGSPGLEDGFGFVTESARVHVARAAALRFDPSSDVDTLSVSIALDDPVELWRCRAPGAPGTGDARFLVIRGTGRKGRFRSLWAWNPGVALARSDDALVVSFADGRRHIHRSTDHGWQIEIDDGGTTHVVTLDDPATESAVVETGGFATRSETQELDEVGDDASDAGFSLARNQSRRFLLDESHYRQSEDSWSEAGEPRAEMTVGWDGMTLTVRVDVANAERTFVSAGALNDMDNEPPDVNGAGVQLYVATEDGRRSGWMLVPEASERVIVRPIGQWGADHDLDATWSATDTGYVVEARIVVGFDGGASNRETIWFDAVVNEKPRGRERRRGQLVFSGGEGEFVYLRGDRHDPHRLIPILVSNG
jgi:hypothetical protein